MLNLLGYKFSLSNECLVCVLAKRTLVIPFLGRLVWDW